MGKENKKSKDIQGHLANGFPFIGPISSTDMSFEFKDKSHMETEIEARKKEKKDNMAGDQRYALPYSVYTI